MSLDSWYAGLMGRSAAVWLCGLLALAGARETFAAGPEDRAQAHATSGKAHFEAGNFEDALRAFQAAHAEVPKPAYLYNIAQCYSRLGDDDRTIEFLNKYLEAEPNAEDRKAIERWLETLEKKKAPPPAVQETREEKPPARLDQEKPAEQPPITAETTPLEPKSRLFTYIAGGTAVAALGAATIFGLSARSEYNALEAGCGATPAGCSEAEIGGAKRPAVRANVLFVVGGVLATAAIALWFVEAP